MDKEDLFKNLTLTCNINASFKDKTNFQLNKLSLNEIYIYILKILFTFILNNTIFIYF